MNKKKVVVLGGGIAGLTAAYWLSHSEELREKYEVEVIQMGWRLGGKIASSRDADGKIVEHGLHVWFGCYDNAFTLMRDVYRRWRPKRSSSITSVEDAFRRHDYSLIGDDGGEINSSAKDYSYHPLSWPSNDDHPWDDATGDAPRPWKTIARLVKFMIEIGRSLLNSPSVLNGMTTTGVRDDQLAGNALDLFKRQVEFLDSDPIRQRDLLKRIDLAKENLDVIKVLETTEAWASLADEQSPLLQGESGQNISALIEGAFERLKTNVNEASLLDASMANRVDRQERFLAESFVVYGAFLRGLVKDILLQRRSIDVLDRTEFRDWLIEHGADEKAVENSVMLRSLYNTMFQYSNGDTAQPNYAAGTAAQVIARLYGTYRGSLLYLPNRGLGEVVITPLYLVLKQQGVAFRFFHKVEKIRLDGSGSKVESIQLGVQAKTKDGRDYVPIDDEQELPWWPDEPNWDQLDCEQQDIDFESHWTPEPTEKRVLQLGRDFDEVILAVSLGAFKPISGKTMCDALFAANEEFQRMASGIELVPSIAAQLWFNQPLEQLGRPGPRPASVSGPPPLGIWTDMTHLTAVEDADDRVKSLHYLCGHMKTDLHLQPETDTTIPNKANAERDRIVGEWLSKYGKVPWPNFKHDMIVKQYARINVNPTDCCPGSAANSTLLRLPAEKSGFSNLKLAGCWTRSGLHTCCIESAVMSGMQAARAIAGEPQRIYGETFLREFDVWQGLLPLQCLIEKMESVADKISNCVGFNRRGTE